MIHFRVKNLFILVLLLSNFVFNYNIQSTSNIDELWQNFKLEYGKVYENHEEELRRYQIWIDNYNYVLEHNNKVKSTGEGFLMGLHNFCDLSQSEVSKLKFGLKLSNEDKLKLANQTSLNKNKLRLGKKSKTKTKTKSSSSKNLKSSDSFNWVDGGFVSSIKDQGTCGACWSFVSTGALESQLRIKQSKTTTLSEQNLIDCSVSYGNDGCDGGLMSQAFEYVRDNHGINPDAIYGYVGSLNRCRYVKTSPAAQVSGYVNLPIDEDILKETVQTIGPVAVGIDADHKSFTLYKGGVYFEPDCSSDSLNHAVLVVGYGSENGKDYWLIKNSWGTSWGENGFGKIARNRNNHCGIASLAGYPLVA